MGADDESDAAGIAAITEEMRWARDSFLAGDWLATTLVGGVLLNNAFQASDPSQYPAGVGELQILFQGIGVRPTHQ